MDATFVGTWEITGCEMKNCRLEDTGIEKTKFQLNESGDVIWTVAAGAEQLALYSCETYEVYSTSSLGVLLRFGAYRGHVLEFRVNQTYQDSIVLINTDGWCALHCRRIKTINEPEVPLDFPFSMLPALEEGFFSDVTIAADNGKEFHVHSSILKMGAAELDWESWLKRREDAAGDSDVVISPPPLSGLPEDVLATVLHYVYSLSLPPGLSEDTALKCIDLAAKLPGFEPFDAACQTYLKNSSLKHQIVTLVNEMHTCAENVVNYFSSKALPGDHSAAENLGMNPPKLCFVVKQSIRECAVAGIKLVMLCELYTKRKSELSREDCHEIIRYAKSRLPIFLSQLCRTLHGLKAIFNSMGASQRNELSKHLVPEIEYFLEIFSSFCEGLKDALEQIIIVMMSPTESSTRSNKPCMSEFLSMSLLSMLHRRELAKVRSAHQKISCSTVHLMLKKESFVSMTTANKVRSVTRNLEQLIEELPVFLLRMEEVMAALDDKFEWREFKFCFIVGTSKVSGALLKLLKHRCMVHDALVQLSEMVQRDAFTQTLVELGLIDQQTQSQEASSSTPSASSKPQSIEAAGQLGSKQLSLVEGLCVPVLAGSSRLAASALKLLQSEEGADMLFEVIAGPPNSADTVSSTDSGKSGGAQRPDPEVHTFKAHRVLVAARCDWFRRALLSGMRESIDRKIMVHDTTRMLFATFLEYLYSGRLEPSELPPDQLTDLMLLADRYELDNLKKACEHALRAHIDDDSVLCLLSMADQFNARTLREACLSFLTVHPEAIESEMFDELPHNLQAEIYEARSTWANPKKMPKRSQTNERLVGRHSGASSPTSADSSLADLEEFNSALRLDFSDSSRQGSEGLLPDGSRLHSCLEQLQDIVGPALPRERLVQVVLAADFDVNRALNFIYSSPDPSPSLESDLPRVSD